MNSDYYIYFDDDFFKNRAIIFLESKDKDYSQFWVLMESPDPEWILTRRNISKELKNKFKITADLFYKLKSLPLRKRRRINRTIGPFYLFREWGLENEILEYFI